MQHDAALYQEYRTSRSSSDENKVIRRRSKGIAPSISSTRTTRDSVIDMTVESWSIATADFSRERARGEDFAVLRLSAPSVLHVTSHYTANPSVHLNLRCSVCHPGDRLIDEGLNVDATLPTARILVPQPDSIPHSRSSRFPHPQ